MRLYYRTRVDERRLLFSPLSTVYAYYDGTAGELVSNPVGEDNLRILRIIYLELPRLYMSGPFSKMIYVLSRSIQEERLPVDSATAGIGPTPHGRRR